MDSFLQQQVSQRSSNTDRLSSLIQQTKGLQSEEWRDDANKLFDSQLNDYSNKASEYVQNKIASTSEGAGVLTQVPHFYSLGTGFYKNVLGERGKTALDETAKGLKIVKDKVNQKIAEKSGVDVEKTIGDVKTRVNNISNQLTGEIPDNSTNLYTYRGVNTSEVPTTELRNQGMETEMRALNPFRSTDEEATREEITPVSNPQLETRNNLANIDEQTPSEIMNRGDITNTISSEERQAIRSADSRISDVEESPFEDPLSTATPVEQAAQNELVAETTELGSAPYIGTANAAAGTEGVSTFGAAGAGLAETGEEVGETGLIAGATELGAADAGLAATGVGAPLAGLLAVGGAIAFGLEELFHHSHKPKAPVMPYSTTSAALPSQYNISSTILPTGSSLQTKGGTMAF